MQINKLTETFAAEIVGAKIADDMSAADVKTILDAFLEHQVIVIRDQNMTIPEQKKFSLNFGELAFHISSKNKDKEHPEILVLSNQKIDGKWVGATNAGDEWHTDSSYQPVPAKCTMLHALEVPEEGGETAFINTYAALELSLIHI